ncbi:MAG: dynamin family protein, partial [Lentisphaeria bacterium]|nr:dynamin family protein [Lentisphaeria bacterium]
MDDYLTRLLNHTVRIAIVGVTSSGKSTFLNSVLGHPFLPTGIPPSSGRQIVCCKDKNNHTFAEVIFTEESGRKTLKIATNMQHVLKQYGDERENPGNSKQVLEIRCHTGAWRLPD